jgi:drug/metabolite transporter (DMT)-like permease
MWIATQMIGGGGLLLSAGLLAGEAPGLEVAAVSARSLLALGYLVVFGSLVGFSAYVWLLRVSTPARVATYAYVNPVVALVLGWAVAGEPLTFRSLAAAAIIIGAVVVITTERARGGGRPGPDPSNPRRRR